MAYLSILLLPLVLGTALSLDNVGGPAALNFGVQSDNMAGIFLPSGFITTEIQGKGFRGTYGRYTNWSCTGANSYEAIGFEQTIDFPSGGTKVDRFCEVGRVSEDGTYFQRKVTKNVDSCTDSELSADSTRLIITDSGILNLTSGVAENVCSRGGPVVGLDTSDGPGLNLTIAENKVGESLEDFVFNITGGSKEFKGDETPSNFQGIFLVDNKKEYGVKIQKDGNYYSEVIVGRGAENPVFTVMFNNYASVQCWGNGLYSADLNAHSLDENVVNVRDLTICSSGKITDTGNLIITNDQKCTVDINQPNTAVLTKYLPEKDATYCMDPTPGLTPICLLNTEQVSVDNAMATKAAKKVASAWYNPEDHKTCGEAPLSDFLDTVEVKKACVNSTPGDVLVYFQGTVPCTEGGKAEILNASPNLPLTLDFSAYEGSLYPEFPSGSLYGPEGAQVMTIESDGTSKPSPGNAFPSSSSSSFMVSIHSVFLVTILSICIRCLV